MRPGSRDRRHGMLITGRELAELKRFTFDMAESFGLDRRIERYRGTRPIGLYRWDLECLEMVTEDALNDRSAYPEKAGPGYEAMKRLHERVKKLTEQAFAEMRGELQGADEVDDGC